MVFRKSTLVDRTIQSNPIVPTWSSWAQKVKEQGSRWTDRIKIYVGNSESVNEVIEGCYLDKI